MGCTDGRVGRPSWREAPRGRTSRNAHYGRTPVLATKTSKPRRARRSRRPSGIPMVEAADPRQADHFPALTRLDRASDRRVAVEPHVRAVLVVVRGVLADQVQEMTLAKHDHVTKQLSTKGAYPPFRVPVLPGGFRRGAELFDTEVSASRVRRRLRRGRESDGPRRHRGRPPRRSAGRTTRHTGALSR